MLRAAQHVAEGGGQPPAEAGASCREAIFLRAGGRICFDDFILCRRGVHTMLLLLLRRRRLLLQSLR
jgi:hypothetical protein